MLTDRYSSLTGHSTWRHLYQGFFQIALAIKDEVLTLKPQAENHPNRQAALREKLPPVVATGTKIPWAIQPPFGTLNCRTRHKSTLTCVTQNLQISSQYRQLGCRRYSFEAKPFKPWNLDELSKNFQTEVDLGLRYPLTTCSTRRWNWSHYRSDLGKVPSGKVWINPDCGLKTRGLKNKRKLISSLMR